MMTIDRIDQGIDDAGKRVLAFVSDVMNYKAEKLTAKLRGMADSGDWRQYKTATGTHNWREAEFDYFLIACECQYQDVKEIIGYAKVAEWLAPLMDHEAEPERRRSLEDASAAYPPVLFETLLQQAQRLGWTKANPGGKNNELVATNSLKVTPIPRRALYQSNQGESKEAVLRRLRAERLSPERRAELETLTAEFRSQLATDDERRYVIDQLAQK